MAKVLIKTYGCSLNSADSETMAGILIEDEHELVYSEEEAEVIIVNSCVVKDKTQGQLLSYLEKWKNKKIIIAGCGPKSIPEILGKRVLISPEAIGKIGEAIHCALKGEIKTFIFEKKETQGFERVLLPKVRKNPIVEIIPINTGCLGACTYCLTKKARGNLFSYHTKDVIDCAKTAISQGVKELWLTSPDTACWGNDLDKQLPELLNKICLIKGEFFIRLGMGNPNHFLKFTDSLIKALKHEKMFKFLHIPVQAGSNKILHSMKRTYTRQEFETLIQKIRNTIPNITIATDIIVGFPGETEKDFQDTINMIKTVKPTVMNISRFAPRPGTKAAEMKEQISSNEKKRRSTILMDLHLKITEEKNKEQIGSKRKIIIDEIGTPGSMIGRTQEYRPVVVKGNYNLGEIIEVEIIDAKQTYLVGKANP